MGSLKQLSNLLGPLPLKSSKRIGANGISYTDKELFTARTIARLASAVCGVECSDPITEEEIQSNSEVGLIAEVFQLTIQEIRIVDLAQCIRRVYRQVEQVMLSSDETIQDFPSINSHLERVPRHQSSLNVMFRKALRDLFTPEEIDIMFKLHIPKKS